MGQSLYDLLSQEDRFKLKRGQASQFDLYVYLATSTQYVLLIHKNELVSETKLKQAEQLWGKNLYVKKSDLSQFLGEPLADETPKLESLLPSEVFEKDILGEPAEKALKSAYQGLLGSKDSSLDEVDPTTTLKEMSDKILGLLVPDVKDNRDTILKQLKNVSYMNNASAISTLAVLIALANDFNSKTSLEALCRAVILMDASLADIDDATMDTYYRNREELPTHVWEKIKNHPLKSQQLVAYMPIANEIVNQLILTHHELHNGKGYHRGIRSGGVLLLGQVLSFAVDFYEKLKAEYVNASADAGFLAVLKSMREKNVEPHSRRHSEKLYRNVLNYLGLSDKI